MKGPKSTLNNGAPLFAAKLLEYSPPKLGNQITNKV